MILRIGIGTVYRKEMMQIQPSDNSISAFSAKSSQDAQTQKTALRDDVTSELGSELASVVRKALEQHQIDHQAVLEAKKAITDGTLDSFEGIEGTAENILSFGI